MISLIQNFEADFLWKVSLKILNSGMILKTFTHFLLGLRGRWVCSIFFHIHDANEKATLDTQKQACQKIKKITQVKEMKRMT